MIEIGDIVRTSYGTGPYRVVKIDRGCCCASYADELRLGYGKGRPSPPHIHLTLVKAEFPLDREPKQTDCYWLNGYAWTDGRWRCVWGGFGDGRADELIVEGSTPGVQLQLFG